MEASTLISVIGIHLLLTYDMSAASASLQCVGYEDLLADVQDDQLTASSEYNSIVATTKSRLTAERAWTCADADNNPWIEVDLLTIKTIEGIVTLGDALHYNRFVRTFTVHHRSDVSDNWVDVSTFDGNTHAHVPVWNAFEGGLVARYVRLYPQAFDIYRAVRWGLISCSKYIQPSVDYLPSPFITPRDHSTIECIKCIDTTNNQIRMKWKGIVINSNGTNLVLRGKSLTCNHTFIKLGIEMNQAGCNAVYALCKIEGSGEEGICHAACSLRDGQIGQALNLLLVVTGEGAELCDVSLILLPSGRYVINDWDVFMQEISGK
ncbi:hypothetical protein CAPTEDRAFT_190127 [Capitella teleta]|uniref:F5/8 type C domain-containing protein n=1 Tax=Capitella teleta TaxID=283909 RepID=R7ULV9_CAPTE|nr:hypothetical protein CAPTEDRAFT_190127 [Capitella teleta]|eukprot:ELU07205.1 hypothetical protein CAPTEDRAFT_190127 [Capitella teleta]